jgi:hypothetical protein
LPLDWKGHQPMLGHELILARARAAQSHSIEGHT